MTSRLEKTLEAGRKVLFHPCPVAARQGFLVHVNRACDSRIVVSRVHPRGFEPLTFGSVDRYSRQFTLLLVLGVVVDTTTPVTIIFM